MRLQPNATTIHPFGYTGRRWDADLGLYYYRARWYDPTLGTFLETDPIGELDYVNLYTYVGLEPGNGVDPTGLERIPLPSMPRTVKIEAFPGPNATTHRAEHGPDHVHVQERGARGDVKVSTETWEPLPGERSLTRTERASLRGMTEGEQDYVRSAQKDIFGQGKISGETNLKGVSASTRRAAGESGTWKVKNTSRI
jgi:RHS repeat-associated protein